MKLEINNLSHTYPNGVKALSDVNLTINKGMFGLLGQNGAGKSTLMRIIATLQNPTKGSVFFDNIDVIKNPQEIRKILGYLPQEFGVYPSVSAEELLLHIANMKGINKKTERIEIVASLLNKVNLYEARKKSLDGFSGGMKQRFGIAQALIGNPKIIIVDEPTAGLDPMERNRFYNLLSEIGENIVVILSTHIVEDVSTLCNNMAIIGNGKVIMHGKPEKIQHELDNMLFEAPIQKVKLQEYQQKFNVISHHFHMGKMIITILSDKKPSDEFKKKTPTLEDAYFKILSKKQAI